MRSGSLLLAVVVVLVCLLRVRPADAANANVRTFGIYERTYADAGGNETSLKTYEDQWVLVVVTVEETADVAREWGEALEESADVQDPSVNVMRFVHLEGVPRLFRRVAINSVKDGPEQGLGLYLDWGGDVAKAFNIDPTTLHLILVQPDGEIAGTFTGSVSGEKIARYRNVLTTVPVTSTEEH